VLASDVSARVVPLLRRGTFDEKIAKVIFIAVNPSLICPGRISTPNVSLFCAATIAASITAHAVVVVLSHSVV
jgi:hypothetical protein